MCGIAGVVDYERPVDEETVRTMTGAVAHRGPDGEGFYASSDGTAGLGHRRLAIIDLEGGGQPISNEDGTVWVSFNGEIYNYVEVRQDLGRRGHRFRTNSDTEVIVHAYEEDGERCVERFRGMFAFALYDDGRRRLLLATDRLGKKPIYYRAEPGRLRFGSELKCLRADGEPLTLDRTALGLYLLLGYIPSPYTIFREVRKARPAERLWFDAGGLRTDTYWDLDYTPGPHATEPEVLEWLAPVLEEAVRIRLRSDVPLGVLLSGGLDSSVVAALAARRTTALRTFSVAFREQQYDESDAARTVARHIGADHVEIVLEPASGYERDLEWVVHALDEPFAVPSVVPTFLISREIGRHCKVVLSGDGGDEGFAGYRHYWEDRWIDPLRRYRALRAAGRAALGGWPLRRGRGPLRRLGLDDLAYARDEERYPVDLGGDPDVIAPETEIVELLRSEYGPPPGVASWDRTSRLQYVDTRRLYLPGHVLVKVDRASMMCGVEVRSPLLDTVLLERLAAVPASLKVHAGISKRLLRRLATRWLPERIVARPKQGFNLPVADWFRGPLAGYVRERLLDSPDLADLARAPAVEALLRGHLDGQFDAHPMLYRLLVLSIWLSLTHRRVAVP